MNNLVSTNEVKVDIQMLVNKLYENVRKEVIATLFKIDFARCRVNPPSEEQLTFDVEETNKINCKTSALKSLFKAARKRQMDKNVVRPVSVAELEYVAEKVDYTTYEDRNYYGMLPHKNDVELLKGENFLKLQEICRKNGKWILYKDLKMQKDVSKILNFEASNLKLR